MCPDSAQTDKDSHFIYPPLARLLSFTQTSYFKLSLDLFTLQSFPWVQVKIPYVYKYIVFYRQAKSSKWEIAYQYAPSSKYNQKYKIMLQKKTPNE